MSNNSLKTEQEFISILLKDKQYGYIWLEKGPEIKFFSEDHRILLKYLSEAINQDVLLTKKSFIKKLKNERNFSNFELTTYEHLYDKIFIIDSDENNFYTFQEEIVNSYLDRKILDNIKDWKSNREKGRSGVLATRKLIDACSDIVGSSYDTKPTIYEPVKDYADKAIKDIEKNKNLSDEEYNKAIVKTGIREIDDMISVGLAPGSLTLFCADVGSFKTTQMLNVGVNVWKSGHNVLFVPLEMPRKLLYYKFLSRVSEIDFSHIINPKRLLTNNEFDRLKSVSEDIKNQKSEFYIMEKPFKTSVGDIKREIEKHLDVFKPTVVIVDYVGILFPDESIKRERNDLQIGFMLKELRSMGKENALTKEGFAILSGAQIGREALKRVRKQGGEKTQFFSEDLRNSQELSADADNIIAQMKNPSEPNDKLDIFAVKARYGKSVFSNGENKTTLKIKPSISLIEDIDTSWYTGSSTDILSKVDDIEVNSSDSFDDIDFDDVDEGVSDSAFSSLGEDLDINQDDLSQFSEDFDDINFDEI